MDAVRPQWYDVYVKYTCNEQNVGSEFILSLDNQKLTVNITEDEDLKPIYSPARIPRKEAYEKSWGELKIGTLTIPQGQHEVYLQSKKIANGSVGDVKSLVFRRVD